MARAVKNTRATTRTQTSIVVDSPADFTLEMQHEILQELSKDSGLQAYLKVIDYDPEADNGVNILMRAITNGTGTGNQHSHRERLRAQAVYLTVLMRTGNHTQASALAGVHPNSVRSWQENDKQFREATEEAKDLYRDTIRKEIHRRAIIGIQKPVFYKGEVVGEITEYSDSLLTLLAKSQMPEFKDKAEVEHSGSVTLVPWAEATPDDLPEGRALSAPSSPSPSSSTGTGAGASTGATTGNSANEKQPVEIPQGHRRARLPVLRASYEPKTVDGEFREVVIPQQRKSTGREDAPADGGVITFKDFEDKDHK